MFKKTVALCQIYITLSTCLQKEFIPIKNNKKWTGNHLMTINVRSLMECSTRCLLEDSCNSFNYIDNRHEGTKTCELKDGWCQDNSNAPFTYDTNSLYYAIQTASFGKKTTQLICETKSVLNPVCYFVQYCIKFMLLDETMVSKWNKFPAQLKSILFQKLQCLFANLKY